MGEAAALVSAFAWAGTSVVMTRLTATVPPVVMSALRLSITTLLLLPVLLLSGQGRELVDAPAGAVVALVGSGLLAYALGDTLYIGALGQLGVQRVFPVVMALFISLTVAGGVILLDESFRWYQGFGAVLVGAGIVIIAREQQGGSGSMDAPRRAGRDLAAGYGLVVVVAIFWSASTLWLADARDEVGTVAASAARAPVAAMTMVGLSLALVRSEMVRPLRNPRELGGIVVVAIAGTLLGSMLYVYAVGEAGAGRTSILNATSPLLALPLAVVFLGERLTRAIALGTLLTVCGVVLVVA